MTNAVHRNRKGSSDSLSSAEKATLEAKMKQVEVDIINGRKDDSERIRKHQEAWADRYRCKVVGVGRKGEKVAEINTGSPKHPDKAHRMNIRLGEWIEEGLPMFIITRLQGTYDVDADYDTSYATGKNSGFYHKQYTTPRFQVQIGKKV